MFIETINHLDKKYSINYKKVLPIPPEVVEIIKNRTGSSVLLQKQNQLFFAEEIVDVEFKDIIPKTTQIIKFEGPSKKKTTKKKSKEEKEIS